MPLSPTISLRAISRELVPEGPASTTSRRSLGALLSVGAGAVFAALVVLHGGDFVRAVDRALHASWKLVAAGALLEAASIAGYVFLLHRVVSRASAALRLRDSYDITLAGTATTRLLPTAGLGGAALTVWALRARGVRTREVTERLVAFLLLLYGVYMAALLLSGTAVALGLVHVAHGRALGALGVALALGIAAAVLGMLALPALTRGAVGLASRGAPRLAARLRGAEQQLPVLRGAVRRAWHELRAPHIALAGALAWWAFDIGVLFAMLHAFGATLPIAVVVLAYFLGTMFNVLPLPGSLSGGLIGVLLALGAPGGAAIAAVLAYRAVAVWLPAAAGVASLSSLRTSVAAWRTETAGTAG